MTPAGVARRALVLALIAGCGKHESAPASAGPSGSAVRPASDAAVTASVPRDAAATPDAPSGPVDPASLPELAAPSAGNAAVEIFAVDAPRDWLLRALEAEQHATFWLVATDTRPITGHLAAASPAAAYEALAHDDDRRSFTRAPRGHGATVDLDFVGAPQRDLLALLGDVAHASIVVGRGDLPDVSVRARRIPATSLVDVLARLDARKVLRMGSTWYFLPFAARPPDAPGLPKRHVQLQLRDATAADAFAAFRAVTGATLSACDGQPLSLRFHGDAADAAPAILAAAGATLSTTPCRLEETMSIDPKTDRLLAVAVSDRLAAAVIARGARHFLVRRSPTSTPPLDIGSAFVSLGDTVLTFPVDPDVLAPPAADFDA